MASSSSKWLVGCGIGCGGMVVLFLILIGLGYFAVRDTVREFKVTIDTFDRLEEEYGRVRDYCPNPDGSLDPERIEAFLKVRQAVQPVRGDMEAALKGMEDRIGELEEGRQPIWRVLGLVGKGMGALPQLAEYYAQRNEALLSEGMSLGEYYFLYSIVYYSWLGKSPGDGPPFRLMGDDNSGYYRFSWEDEEIDNEADSTSGYGEDFIRRRRFELSRYINHVTYSMMRNQVENFTDRSSSVWRQRLNREVKAMEDDLQRIPWQDGLPPSYIRVLAPYRESLDASYSAMLNPLELRPVNQ